MDGRDWAIVGGGAAAAAAVITVAVVATHHSSTPSSPPSSPPGSPPSSPPASGCPYAPGDVTRDPSTGMVYVVNEMGELCWIPNPVIEGGCQYCTTGRVVWQGLSGCTQGPDVAAGACPAATNGVCPCGTSGGGQCPCASPYVDVASVKIGTEGWTAARFTPSGDVAVSIQVSVLQGQGQPSVALSDETADRWVGQWSSAAQVPGSVALTGGHQYLLQLLPPGTASQTVRVVVVQAGCSVASARVAAPALRFQAAPGLF